MEATGTIDTNSVGLNHQETIVDRPIIKNNRRKMLLIASLVLILVITGLVLWFSHIFSVYNKATIYKESYDEVQTQLQYCNSIAGTSQKQEIFNYCSEFKNRMKTLKQE